MLYALIPPRFFVLLQSNNNAEKNGIDKEF